MRLQRVNRKGMGSRGLLRPETARDAVIQGESGFKQFPEARLLAGEMIGWVGDHNERWAALERLRKSIGRAGKGEVAKHLERVEDRGWRIGPGREVDTEIAVCDQDAIIAAKASASHDRGGLVGGCTIVDGMREVGDDDREKGRETGARNRPREPERSFRS